MNKDSWKKVLESFEDEELIALSQTASLSVPGFRQVNLNNIKRSKKLLINEAIKPRNLRLVIRLLNKKAELEEAEEERKNYREMKLEELLKSIEDGVKPYKILASLYSSENEQKIILASQLEEKLEEIEEKTKPAVEPEEKSKTGEKETKTEEELRKLIINLEKKIKRAEQRNIVLSEKNIKLGKELKESLEKAKEERKELNRKVTSVSQENAKLISEIEKLEEEAYQTKKLLEDKDVILAERAGTISHLNAKLLASGKIDNGKKEEEISLVDEAGKVPAKIRIALLGNPKNKAILKNSKYKLEVFEPTEFETVTAEVDWEGFQDVWLLTYKVPAKKQALVYSGIKKPIKEVSSFEDLRTLIERGK